MCHEGQKRINRIASGLRGNEISMYGYSTTSIENTRKYVKRHKLHYTVKMMQKAKYKGTW